MLEEISLINTDSLDEEIEVKFFMAVSKLLILCQKIENDMKSFLIMADLVKGKDVETVNESFYTMGNFSVPFLKYIKEQIQKHTENINWFLQQLNDYPSDQEFVFEKENIVKNRKDMQDIIEEQRALKKKYKEMSNTVGVTVKLRNILCHELMKEYSFVISDQYYAISTIFGFIESKTKWLHKHAKYVFKCDELITNITIASNYNSEFPYIYPKQNKKKMDSWVFYDLNKCIATYRDEYL